MNLRSILSGILLAGLLSGPGWSQESGTPVAVISLVWGVVTVKHADADYKPARWLEPIFPGDFVKTSGPGSKLLITFFNDNHQEVVSENVEASVATDRVTAPKGQVRRDKARNPFGAGGVDSPFVYTHKLVAADFAKAEVAGAYDVEERSLKASIKSHFPPDFGWPSQAGASNYELQVNAPSLAFSWSKTLKANRYSMTQREAGGLSKGSNYTWQVSADGNPVVLPYPFKCLSLPQAKWLEEESTTFSGKRARKQLQRSDYTDYLLVCSQLTRVDEAYSLCREMAGMDSQNPRVFRALTRVFLLRGCPAHAKEAHDNELKLGGYDPVGL